MKKSLKVVGWLFFSLLILGALGTILPGMPSSIDDKKSQAKFYCFERAKELLKTPSVAQFNSPDFYNDFQVVNDKEIKLKAYIDSQNSFGAMMRKNFVCSVKFNKDNVFVQVKF